MDRKKEFKSVLLQMMHEKGYKGATMRLLAERLDCDVANIYNYMSSKQSKLDEFLFELSDKFHLGIDEIISSGYSEPEKIKQLVHLYVQMSASMPYQMSLLVNDWRYLAPDRQVHFLKERTRFEKKVRAIIEEGVRQGSLNKIQPEIATHLLLASTRWLFNYFTRENKANPVELERQISIYLEYGLIR